MQTWSLEVLGLLLSLLLGAGPIAGLIALLNLRDRRAAGWLAAAGRHLPGARLRSDLAVSSRARLLWPGGVVRIETGTMPREEIWPEVSRLRQALPASVAVVLEGRGPAGRTTRMTLDLIRPPRQGALPRVLRRAV